MYSLIIVDYCSMEKTIKYVEHFWSRIYQKSKLQVVIIDNDDMSKGLELLEQKYYEYELIRIVDIPDVYKFQYEGIEIAYCSAGLNLGYAKGNNLGTKIADMLFHTSYYIISNNDLRLDSLFCWDEIKRLFEDKPEIAVVGPKIVGTDGKVQSPHKRISAFKRLILYYWFNRWPFRWKPDYDYSNESKKCYRVMGCFMIIRAEAFHKVDGFDENTFMFAEEPILSERLSQYGYNSFFYNEYTVVHEHGASIKKVNSFKRAEQWSFDSNCYYYREYLKTSNFLIKIAKINFKVYLLVTGIKIWIKKLLKKASG